MSSVLREVGRRKRKSRRLETVDVIDRKDFNEMELDSRVEAHSEPDTPWTHARGRSPQGGGEGTRRRARRAPRRAGGMVGTPEACAWRGSGSAFEFPGSEASGERLRSGATRRFTKATVR
jgi:hypothetical protein